MVNKNLLEINDDDSVKEVLSKINQGENIRLSINHNGRGKKLLWNDKCLLVFDVCKYGQDSHNAKCVVRDLLKQHHSEKSWTLKQVENLVTIK
ncbi:MAG: hypothetical protein WCL02_00480 [bacterium]